MAQPATVGNYKIVRQLGTGVMGDVYLGVSNNSYWALRVMNSECIRSTAAVGKLVGDPIHDAVVRYKEVGADPQVGGFVSTDFVDARPVSRDGLRGLRSAERLRFVLHLLEGLEAMHRKGVVHGAIKPSNVLLRRPKGQGPAQGLFIDAGFQYVPSQARLPRLLRAAFPYLAPEVIEAYVSGETTRIDKVLTVAADIYGVGLLLAEVLSGRRLFTHSRSIEELLARKRQALVQVTGLNDPVEHLRMGALDAALKAATHHDPGQRPGSVAALCEAVAHALPDTTAPAA